MRGCGAGPRWTPGSRRTSSRRWSGHFCLGHLPRCSCDTAVQLPGWSGHFAACVCRGTFALPRSPAPQHGPSPSRCSSADLSLPAHCPLTAFALPFGQHVSRRPAGAHPRPRTGEHAATQCQHPRTTQAHCQRPRTTGSGGFSCGNSFSAVEVCGD